MWRLTRNAWIFLLMASVYVTSLAESDGVPDRQVYFGDLHIHTKFSLDAFRFGTRTSPDDAYRFAKGESLRHPAGFDVQLDQPLDFYAVTDHAEYLGALATYNDPAHPRHERAKEPGVLDLATVFGSAGGQAAAAARFVPENYTSSERQLVWQEIIAAAERHNESGVLTTFIAFEYTSFRQGGNLHRNVVFKSGKVPADVFGRLDAFNPEELWHWMDRQRNSGMEVLAIPHNSNGSDGWMFESKQWDGSAIDRAYAELRMRNEPIVEVTQVKGTSETHPFLSPNDEWADFEIFPYRIAQWRASRPQGSYVRDAYLTGLRLAATTGANPYKFGLVGASDTHNSGSRFDEKNFVGKVGTLDAFPERRGSVPVDVEGAVPAYRRVYRTHYGAAGLTGVWAEENSRASIFQAFRRKETFATSGPRIRIRMFAGEDLPGAIPGGADLGDFGYRMGVPQGSDLLAGETSPHFLVMALQDPGSASLQRLQIVKGWFQDGRAQEQVYDIACSDGLSVDPTTHRCPDNGASVDVTTCAFSQDKGSPDFTTSWTDPDYDAGQSAFYYARVLENPTCRWSTWDAIRAGAIPKWGHPTTLQERAWTSPIWVSR